ncbi:hypothetical protein BC941DRAFT_408686 [Chlamydoabsidia padenii]|nr:hypothetical protein BC941DRAFT_408686 [Chlamydoabsidia padenii]
MRTHYSDIGELEKKVLQDQYETSPFYLNKKEALKPVQLDIFDFDSTLFLSPSLSPTIWHPSLIKQLVGEDVFGPGWWKDYRSLDLGPIDELEKTQWANYWNEDIVAKARQSLQDPTIMTVVLTGRRAIPFYPMISRMLTSKQLDFDLLGLRPDPTQECYNDHVKNNKTTTTYGASSVFVNTLDFKTCFILNLLHNIPSLKQVNMWDDRLNHVKRFEDFLCQLTHQGLLTPGSSVEHVKPVLPRYRPLWEQKVVTHVLETHNANELLYQQEQKWNRAISTIQWDTNDDISKVAKHLSLEPIPSSTVIKLDPSTVEQLRAIVEPYYHHELRKQHQEWTGWRAKAEVPQWFGRQVILSSHTAPPLGTKWTIAIDKLSRPDPDIGLVALVTVKQKRYIMPLIHKPSQANSILKKKFTWTDVPADLQRQFGPGTVAVAYLLGLDGKVKGGQENQLVCLDKETQHSVLGKRAIEDDGPTTVKKSQRGGLI